MDSEQFRKAAASSIDEIINYYDTIEDRRVVSNVEPGYLRKLLPSKAPENGEPWADIQADIETKIQPGLTHWQSPRYMAWFPASSTYPGILGDMYSAAFTSANFNWICSPAVTELETVVLDWVAQLLHLPDCFMSHGAGGGVIQGSASETVVTCMVAARERYLEHATAMLDGEAKEDRIAQLRGKLVALGGEQAHSGTMKGARIAGVRYKGIPAHVSDNYAMTGVALKEVLEECTAKGLIPFYLTTTLGTTATCAVDHFGEIAAVLKDYPEIWAHIDAAYAGSALALPEYAHLTEHFPSFDSFNMNLHKWGLVNFDASCLYIKQRRDLTDALTVTPSYLRHDLSEQGLVTDYRDWQIPLGRRFRSLKIWFVLRTYGTKGFQEHIRKHIKMGEMFAELVRSRQDLFCIVAPPAFALTALTCVPPKANPAESISHAEGKTDKSETEGLVNGSKPFVQVNDKELQAANELTKQVYELINKRGEIFLTSGVVNGVYAIRVVSANPKAEEKYLRLAYDILCKTTEEVVANGSKGLTNGA